MTIPLLAGQGRNPRCTALIHLGRRQRQPGAAGGARANPDDPGSPDIFLGWSAIFRGRHFYAPAAGHEGHRHHPRHGQPRHFVEYCQLCGWSLALAMPSRDTRPRSPGTSASRRRWMRPSPTSRWPMASAPGKIMPCCWPPSPAELPVALQRPVERFPLTSPGPFPGGERGTDRGSLRVETPKWA